MRLFLILTYLLLCVVLYGQKADAHKFPQFYQNFGQVIESHKITNDNGEALLSNVIRTTEVDSLWLENLHLRDQLLIPLLQLDPHLKELLQSDIKIILMSKAGYGTDNKLQTHIYKFIAKSDGIEITNFTFGLNVINNTIRSIFELEKIDRLASSYYKSNSSTTGEDSREYIFSYFYEFDYGDQTEVQRIGFRITDNGFIKLI